jgi:hypothetical protein
MFRGNLDCSLVYSSLNTRHPTGSLIYGTLNENKTFDIVNAGDRP